MHEDRARAHRLYRSRLTLVLEQFYEYSGKPPLLVPGGQT
jgi:hypothetical protein